MNAHKRNTNNYGGTVIGRLDTSFMRYAAPLIALRRVSVAGDQTIVAWPRVTGHVSPGARWRNFHEAALFSRDD